MQRNENKELCKFINSWRSDEITQRSENPDGGVFHVVPSMKLINNS